MMQDKRGQTRKHGICRHFSFEAWSIGSMGSDGKNDLKYFQWCFLDFFRCLSTRRLIAPHSTNLHRIPLSI